MEVTKLERMHFSMGTVVGKLRCDKSWETRDSKFNLVSDHTFFLFCLFGMYLVLVMIFTGSELCSCDPSEQ